MNSTYRSQKQSKQANPKVGILFNQPTGPLRGESIDFLAEAGVEDAANAVQEALETLAIRNQLFPIEDDIVPVIRVLKKYRPDVVINLCEGFFGDSHLEMNVAAFLELVGFSYTGSPHLTLGVCQDKGFTKGILRANSIPTPNYRVLRSVVDWKSDMPYPLFVKPSQEDASIGISSRSFVRDERELKDQVKYIARTYRQPALVEEYIAGREFNVAILGTEKARALPISEIVFGFGEEPKIVGYSAKWLKESSEYEKTKPVCPANLDQATKNKIEQVALQAYEALRCRDYARVDMRLRDEIPWVLEVNPNPDISLDAGFARALKAAGIGYDEFVKTIVFFALERH
jgi:D-alanine-D-alanine ligase